MSEASERERPIVLFLRSGNSARSQMAEGWLRHLAGDRLDARSAGISPREFAAGSNSTSHPERLRDQR